MKSSALSAVALLATVSMLLSGCGQATQLSPGSTAVPRPMQYPLPALPSVGPTETLTSTPTTVPPTLTATPLPGVELLPVLQLAASIPWLPYDEANKPMAVYYGFNVEQLPFDNVLVRQAFAAAVDRAEVAEKALGYRFPNAVPATSLTPPQVPSRDLYNEVGIPYDPDRAKELLKQAGYADGAGFPSATLLVSTRGKGAPGAYYQMAKLVVDMWETNLGVKVIIESAEINAYGDRFANNPPGLYQLGWVADYKDPNNFLGDLFHSNRQFNWGHYRNPEFDRIVDDAARANDPQKRLLLYIRAEQLLAETDAALIPLFHSYRPTPYVY